MVVRGSTRSTFPKWRVNFIIIACDAFILLFGNDAAETYDFDDSVYSDERQGVPSLNRLSSPGGPPRSYDPAPERSSLPLAFITFPP